MAPPRAGHLTARSGRGMARAHNRTNALARRAQPNTRTVECVCPAEHHPLSDAHANKWPTPAT
eukprot:2229405-Pyramimonas_sp.AAC.1